MKKLVLLISQKVNLMLGVLLLCTCSVSAQIRVEDELHHKVLLDNSYLRLLDGYVKSKDTTVTHTHSANSVVVFLSQSLFGIKNTGEKPIITAVNPGDVVYRNYFDKPVNHIVWEQGPLDFHFMVIELKRQAIQTDMCSPLTANAVQLALQKESARSYKLSLRSGEQFKIEKSTCAYLLISVSGSVSAGPVSSTRVLQPNDFIFYPPQSKIEMKNNDINEVACVLVELR